MLFEVQNEAGKIWFGKYMKKTLVVAIAPADNLGVSPRTLMWRSANFETDPWHLGAYHAMEYQRRRQ